MGKKRSAEREEFLFDVFSTAIEHGGYGFFYVKEYRWENLPPAEAYAVIVADEGADDPGAEYRVDLDTIAKGLGVIRTAVMAHPEGAKDLAEGETVPVNARTGERLYFGGPPRQQLMLADRTNGDDGDYDVIGALAVLECALFGRVVYG